MIKNCFAYWFICLTLFCTTGCHAKRITNSQQAILSASNYIGAFLPRFQNNLTGQIGIDSAIERLVRDINPTKMTPYHQFVLGNLIYAMDPNKSFIYHELAFRKKPNELNFILEYAIELHRKQKYALAIDQYRRYLMTNPDNPAVHTWLADCFINEKKLEAAVNHWMKADHASHHIGIDQAIHTIYGLDPLAQRDSLLKRIKAGDVKLLYALIALDANWQTDWWNLEVKDDIMKNDILFAEKKFGDKNEVVKTLLAYQSIKGSSDSKVIKDILMEEKLILDDGKIPESGKMASDIINICIESKIIDEKSFYARRGSDILRIAEEKNDVDMLNLYAHLQLAANGKVGKDIALIGWRKYSDERFAYDYFIEDDGYFRCNDMVIDTAIRDFPNSSLIFSIKYACAEPAFKKELAVELIRREFKSLRTDPNRYSYKLKEYFSHLQEKLQ